MNLKSKFKPTDAELEILRVLWKEGGSTVRLINEILNASREVGYTTTLKILQIMEQKAMVKVDRSSRTHLYTAIIREDETQKHLLDELLESAFGGSAEKLVMQALGNNKTSQKELDEIKNLIKQLEGGKQ